jgi:hypothetical protein
MECYTRSKSRSNHAARPLPGLAPTLLHALAAMGHGDRILLVDANYPATRGRHNPGLRLRLDPATAVPASHEARAAESVHFTIRRYRRSRGRHCRTPYQSAGCRSRHRAGDSPNFRLNARLKASSDP